jgi:hypothetical protein
MFALPRMDMQVHRSRIQLLEKQRNDSRKENKPTLTYEQRAQASKTRNEREDAIMSDIAALEAIIEEHVARMAKNHCRKPEAVRSLVYHRGKLSKKSRGPNKFNAWQHFVSVELNDCEFFYLLFYC